MSTYCISDLHGRYDLFKRLLKEIDFNTKTDHLFFLGDVIDHHYGGIRILKYIIENENSCTLILGNHEENFMFMQDAYDVVMLNPSLKKVFKDVVSIYSPLFKQIYKSFRHKISSKNIDCCYSVSSIKKWLKNGNTNVRKKLLDAMILLIKAIDFDKNIFDKIFYILSDMHAQYKTKEFVKELLEQDTATYYKILELCKNAKIKYSLRIEHKSFVLSHSIQNCFDNPLSYRFYFPHANSVNTYYIFGHRPIPTIHRDISNKFQFNYKNAFSIVDHKNNFYYNLDLGSSKSNPQVVLRLDDIKEFYVSELKFELPKPKRYLSENRSFWIEEECADDSTRSYITTFKGNSYEYLIVVYSKEKCIIYFRVDLLDWNRNGFLIENWYSNQSIDQIIKKVEEDYIFQMSDPQNKKFYRLLCGKID